MADREHLREDENQDIDPDRHVGQPSKPLQRPNLTDDETGRHEDDQAGDEADFALGNLGNGLAVAQNQDGHGEEQLDGLADVDEVAGPLAVDAEEQIAKGLHRVFIRVHVDEDAVDLEARVQGQGAEDGVQGNAGTVTHLSSRPLVGSFFRRAPPELLTCANAHGTENGPRISVVIR
jgi:hypothetical protein